METSLALHGIRLTERPVWRHDRTEIVERKNRTRKTVLERLQNDNSKALDATLLSKIIFLSNMLSGSRFLSSFELAWGCGSALLGV